jgi:hypothetical protein
MRWFAEKRGGHLRGILNLTFLPEGEQISNLKSLGIQNIGEKKLGFYFRNEQKGCKSSGNEGRNYQHSTSWPQVLK